jgi:hypothetical protein
VSTPDPWFVVHQKDCFEIWNVPDPHDRSDGKLIATVWKTGALCDPEIRRFLPEADELVANADLIRFAPRMVHLLRRLRDSILPCHIRFDNAEQQAGFRCCR